MTGSPFDISVATCKSPIRVRLIADVYLTGNVGWGICCVQIS